jgi:hypothetical protein
VPLRSRLIKEVSCIAGQPHDLEAKQLLKKQLPADWE